MIHMKIFILLLFCIIWKLFYSCVSEIKNEFFSLEKNLCIVIYIIINEAIFLIILHM